MSFELQPLFTTFKEENLNRRRISRQKTTELPGGLKDKGEEKAEETWGVGEVSQAELIFTPEEELQLPARAGPGAGRAGPSASPPLLLPPFSPFLLPFYTII